MLPTTYHPRTPPMRHQLEALEAGWELEGFAYLLEMGLGKSRVLIDDFCLNHEANEVDGLLVVASKSVYSNWTRQDDKNPGELQQWTWAHIKETMRVHTYHAGRSRKDAAERLAIMDAVAPGVRVLVMNIEALSSTMEAEEVARQFLRAHKCMFVIDESTLIKNPKSRRTKVCLKLARLAKKRRILTGSPSTGSMADVWPQFEFLGPGQALLGHRLFSTFRARYCVLRDIVVAGRTIQTEVGSQNVDELAEAMKPYSFRRLKKDCLDLPPKSYAPRREVDLTDEQKRAYTELRRHAMTAVQGQEITTDIVLTQMLRMHQVICGHVKTDDGQVIKLKNNRVPELMAVLEQARRGEQVVIWCNWRPDIEVVLEELARVYGPDSFAQWHGGVRMEERERDELLFQRGERRFMVASQSAGARGRTWTAATLVVYYSNNTDLELREQSEDRTHRIGTTGTVTYVDIVCPGTLDEKIIESLREKKSVVRQVLQDGVAAWI